MASHILFPAHSIPYQQVLEVLPGMHLVLSADLIIESASEQFLKQTALSKEETIGKYIWEIYAPHSEPAMSLKSYLEGVLQTKISNQIEASYYRILDEKQNGQRKYHFWQIKNIPLLNEKGELACLLQQIEEVSLPAASKDEDLYRLLMQAPVGIALLRGPELIYEMANERFLLMVGRTQAILGKAGREVFSEAVAQGIWDLMEGVYQSGQPYVGKEFKALLDMNGKGEIKEQYYDFVFQPLKNTSGQAEALLITALDVSYQVQARKKVEENAFRMEALLETIPQMAWTANTAGELDYFNSQWHHYTGQGTEEALGNGWIEVTHPDDVKSCLPQWQYSLQTGTLYQVECRYKSAGDGTWRWHLTRAVAVKNKEGKILHWVGTCTDIDAQKEYMAQVAARESYFRQMADHVPVMIYVKAPDGSCMYLNKPWYDYTGQKQEEALGLGWLWAIHPQDKAYIEKVFLEANTRQQTFSVLYRLRHKDGTYRYVLDKAEPNYDTKGNFNGFVGAVIDVDEQHKAEERLRLSVKAGKVGIWEWDTVHNRATYSDLLQDMFGFGAGTLPDNFENAYQVFESIMHPEDKQQVDEQVSKALADPKQADFYIEFRIIRPSGEVRWIAERGKALFEGGKPVQMNGTCIDITALKKVEQAAQRLSEELAAANEELRAANEEIQSSNEELSESNRQLFSINADLDNFVYTASHDLKAPILNMEGLLKRLERRLSKVVLEDEAIAQIYQLLYASVVRFKTTIADLTEVARITKETTTDTATVSLQEVLSEVLGDLEIQIMESETVIETKFEWNSLHFSRKNLKSILYNLLTNAIKYSSAERKPFIQLTCRIEANYQVLSVKDNGLGIDRSQQDKLFTLFKRLHTHVDGTGIGLYIVKKMIENAGGKIEVESELGVGSTFSVYFKN